MAADRRSLVLAAVAVALAVVGVVFGPAFVLAPVVGLAAVVTGVIGLRRADRTWTRVRSAAAILIGLVVVASTVLLVVWFATDPPE